MPRKINKRKAIQAAKRKAVAEDEARKNKRWPWARRVATIAHYHHNHAALAALLLGAKAFQTTIDFGPDGKGVADE